MSQKKRKYPRIEAILSRIRPVAPESPARAEAGTGASSDSPAGASPAGGRRGFFPGSGRGKTVGFAFDRDTVTSLEEAPLSLPENALRVPLAVSGKTVGSLQAAGGETGWTAEEIEIVGAVAAELARHIETLRRVDRRE